MPLRHNWVLQGGWCRGFIAGQPGGKVLADHARPPLEARLRPFRMPWAQNPLPNNGLKDKLLRPVWVNNRLLFMAAVLCVTYSIKSISMWGTGFYLSLSLDPGRIQVASVRCLWKSAVTGKSCILLTCIPRCSILTLRAVLCHPKAPSFLAHVDNLCHNKVTIWLLSCHAIHCHSLRRPLSREQSAQILLGVTSDSGPPFCMHS